MSLHTATTVANGRPPLTLLDAAPGHAIYAYAAKPSLFTIGERFKAAGATVHRIEVDGAQTTITVWYKEQRP